MMLTATPYVVLPAGLLARTVAFVPQIAQSTQLYQHAKPLAASFTTQRLATACMPCNKQALDGSSSFYMYHPPLATTFAISRGFAAQSIPQSTVDESAEVRKLGSFESPDASAGGPRGKDESFAAGYVAPHPGMRSNVAELSLRPQDRESFMDHPTYYDMKYLESIKPIHMPPKTAADRAGLFAVQLLRRSFDLVTGYGPNMTEAKWLQRILFLETVAGVPGMVAGMLRHLHSLRLFRRDAGWIHTLLEEAENERMHLLTFFELRKPGPLFRAMVLLSQGIFFNLYFIAYLVWPKACHSFVGYLEEEAVRTYTHALKDIDEGKVWKDKEAPAIAQTYWQLRPKATMRELILAVRADEACHSHVNHTLKQLKPTDANPFAQGKSQLP